MELIPGAQLGPYRLIERAGQGGMAEVWKAYQPRLERFVAVKVLSHRYAALPGFLERFRRETLAISHLEHPNILTVFDSGEQDGFTYMVTPFIAGGTLAERLGRPWSAAQARAVLEPLASALDYAHAQGVIHRDLKPSNVLITEQGRIILGDFGVARVLEATESLTHAGAIVGTPAYMSPEQASGQPAGPASDLYSLGLILYELLTGRPPFQAETPLAVALAHVHQPLPPPRSLNPALTEALEAVLFKALAKDPNDRYPTGTALVQALAQVDARGPGGQLPPERLSSLQVQSPAASARSWSPGPFRWAQLVWPLVVMLVLGSTLGGWWLRDAWPGPGRVPPSTVAALAATTPTNSPLPAPMAAAATGAVSRATAVVIPPPAQSAPTATSTPMSPVTAPPTITIIVATVTPAPSSINTGRTVAGTWQSDFGPVTLQQDSADGQQFAAVSGFWIQGAGVGACPLAASTRGCRGVITKGTFNPVTGVLEFSYDEDWVAKTGSARLTLSPDGRMLAGTWTQPGSSGTWTMLRQPAHQP